MALKMHRSVLPVRSWNGERVMSGTHRNLQGGASQRSDTALLLIDVINDLEFPEGEQLLEHALPMADRLLEL